MANDWQETPQSERAYAMRFESEGWKRCEYSDLRKGDIFRAYACDGTPMHPVTAEEIEDGAIVAIVLNNPVHSHPDLVAPEQILEIDGYIDWTKGWAVEIETYGSLQDLIRSRSS